MIHQFRHAPSLNGVFALLLAGQLVVAAGEGISTAGMSADGLGAGAAAVKLAELTGRLRVGAEYFLNRSDTRETVFRHLRSMADHGLSVVRIFVIWDDVERVEGQWDFSRYDWIYEAAKESGLFIATTLCAEDPPGWRKQTPFYHSRINLNDPANRKRGAVYIDKVVRRYKDHPAQGPWLLMNEPTLKVNFERSTLQAFGRWLQARYGSVDRLNERWFAPLRSFDEVQVSPEQWVGFWIDYPSLLDWKEFNLDNLVEGLAWISGRVKALDPTHPTHVNLYSLPFNLPANGQDPWKESAAVDFLGTSMHPPGDFADYGLSAWGELFAYGLDLTRSAAGDRPWWLTETQGGPTVFAGRRSIKPGHGDITRRLWESFGAGARAVVFWQWNFRTLGREGGEWGLTGLDGEPTERAQAIKEVTDALKRLPVLAESKPIAPQVAILYNRQSLLLCDVDGLLQNRKADAVYSLMGCYQALHRAHVQAAFLDLDGLKRGVATNYAVLYAPYSYALDDEALAAIRNFVGQGGTLWADGLFAWKTAWGGIRPGIPGGAPDLFGVQANEAEGLTEPYSVTEAGEQAGDSWRLPLVLKGAEVTVRDREGRPFATTHAFGKGRGIYYATALTLGHFRRGHPAVAEWITAPAAQACAAAPAAVELVKAQGALSFRPLLQPGGALALLVNWGNADEVVVRFRGRFTTGVDLLGSADLTRSAETDSLLVKARLRAGQVCLIQPKL